MKREFIKGLLGENATKEIIDSILDENGKDIEAEKQKASTLQAQLDNANKSIKTYETQLEQLKNSPDNPETLKQTITQLQNDNAAAKKQYEADIKKIKVDNALEKALSAAGAKNSVAVKALLKDLDKAELAEDGTIKGLDEQIKALQKSDAYMFNQVSNKRTMNGTKPAASNPNGDSGADVPAKPKTYEDFVKIVESENN